MVKIIHMADTHLGYRPRRGTVNKWAIENYSKPFEQEIYDIFLKIMEDVSNHKDIDFIVHCGDIFHHPSLYSSYPPPEPARRALKEGLDTFFKNTKGRIPFIYVEGNHGVYRAYDYTPFESHVNKEQYPNLFYFKAKDLLDAIRANKPLKIEFSDKKVRFYLFPYFEFGAYETYKTAYDDWITKQKPIENDDYVNIAIAHGSTGDQTLHKKVSSNDFGYEYVALGHEHGLKKVSINHYYSGSLLPMNFKERYESQGYLIVDINNTTRNLDVKKVFTDNLLNRTFELVQIDVNPNQSLGDLEQLINNELEEHISETGFNSKTSARVKFKFIGEISFEKYWQINELMSKIRRDCFSKTEIYNIMQIIWKISDISEILEDDISAGAIQDYILEKPDDEFKSFVEEKLSEEKTQYNIDKLTEFGMKALKNALRIMEREKEV